MMEIWTNIVLKKLLDIKLLDERQFRVIFGFQQHCLSLPFKSRLAQNMFVLSNTGDFIIPINEYFHWVYITDCEFVKLCCTSGKLVLKMTCLCLCKSHIPSNLRFNLSWQGIIKQTKTCTLALANISSTL